MTERFNSGELKSIFRVNFHKFLIGLTIVGKHAWEEERKGDSVLYWCFRNNCLSPSSSRTFRTQSYWSFITGQCCNSERILPSYLPHWCAFNLHSIINNGLILGGQKIRARDRQYSSCLLILGTKVTRFLMRLTWMHHVVHHTCTMHGRDIKTRYIRLILILQFGKD